MHHKAKKSRFLSILSGIYIAAALCLLLGVCAYCYPSVNQKMKQVLGGGEDGPVQQAFAVFTEGLESGEPLRETFSTSFEVLTGEAD